MRAVGLFCDLAYYPALVAVVNSILHFQVQARIKVYDFDGLPHLVRTYLERWAEVVAPPAEILGDHYRDHWFYRPRFLAAAGIAPAELLLDADTVVLCDLEEAFRAIEAGRVVAVREWDYRHPDSARDCRPLPADSVFHRLLAHPEIYRQGLPIYNGGLLGFHGGRHQFLLDLWRRPTACHQELDGTFFALDQHSLSLILASLRREGRVEVHELPPRLWMETWQGHREPRKRLAFEDGTPVLFNGDVGRMRFYHYTGDILAPEAIAGSAQVPVRFSYLVSDLALPPGPTQEQMREAWNQVWRERHATPAGELPEHFYRQGPLRAPRCMDPAWRDALARLLGADRDAREVWALALAHDYVDYCGFRAAELGWLADPLAVLLGERRLLGERTIGWESGADVVLSFAPRAARRREWSGGDPGAPPGTTEHHRGVFLDFA